MIMGTCYGCFKVRKLKRVGGYTYGKREYPIMMCQWCRAAATRQKKAILPEPYLKRKGGR